MDRKTTHADRKEDPTGSENDQSELERPVWIKNRIGQSDALNFRSLEEKQSQVRQIAVDLQQEAPSLRSAPSFFC
jgi:hypothetical protein